MTLPVEEFIRRFLLHVLPHRFVCIRYYGFLAHRHRDRDLERCRALLGAEAPAPEPEEREGWQAVFLRVTGHDPTLCERCGRGRLRLAGDLPGAADRSPPWHL
jgi:hypothetical protein